MGQVRTQNGRYVTSNDHIVVAHNDHCNSQTSNFGQWFIATYKSAANYDSPYDPILFMPRTGYVSGSEEHRKRSEELRELAEVLAKAIRQHVAEQTEAEAA